MKHLHAPLAIALGLVLAAPLAHAISGYNDSLTTDNGSWSSWAPGDSTGSLGFANSRLEYTTTVSSSEFASQTLTTYQAPYASSSWAVQVDMHLINTGSFAVPTSWVDLNLIVSNASAALGTSKIFCVTLERWTDGTLASPSSSNSIYANTGMPGGASVSSSHVAAGSADVALRITFNSSSKLLTAYYDGDGATNGYTWTSLWTANVGTGDTYDMGLTSADKFGVSLVADAGINDGSSPYGVALASGDAYFSNLKTSGLVVVPEPSTYGLIASVAALGLAALTRRRRA